jgi:predicted RNase H-like HicB family nuclease
MEYLVIFEECNDGGYSAYVPDLPVCFTVGDTLEDTKENIKEAIELYLEDLKETGKEIPQPPHKMAAYIAVAA